MERTLILIKPDGVARGLVGQIVARIEAKGYADRKSTRLNSSHSHASRMPSSA